MQTRNPLSLLFTFLSTVLFIATARAEVGLLGGERIVFGTLFGDSTGVNYPCGRIARTVTGPNYSVDNEPYFDGPISPISYPDGAGTTLRFNASVGYHNYRILSSLHPDNTFSDGVLQCAPVYTAGLSADNSSFNWAEWLYGTFRDVPNSRVFAVAYNEYYGGTYYPTHGSTYSALGLTVSYDNGASFQKIQAAPNHVFVRAPYLWPDGGGHGYQGGIFKSPLDGMYYVGVNADYTLASMVRTNNLDDPTSWYAWDGSGFNIHTLPVSPNFFNIEVAPFYLGYSDYFKKYIAVTTGNAGGDPNRGNYQIVYKLSDDLVHWGDYRRIIDNPACPGSGICDSVYSYPSAMDPAYLNQTGDSVTASNGILGAYPFLTYIKNFSPPSQHRQEFTVQQISFDQVPTNRLDNFSVRGVVGPGQDVVMGFIIQGTESKEVLIRAMGPSLGLPPDFGYDALDRPGVDLRDAYGNLVASNQGWRSLPQDQLDRLSSIGFAPGSDYESAVVKWLPPGAYTATMYKWWPYYQMSGLRRGPVRKCTNCDYYGVGVLEGYDLSSLKEGTIAQVSVRGYSRPGNGALIMGFLSRGGQTAIVRGTGQSSLAPFGFSPVIPDPYISVSKNGGFLIDNNNWGSDPNWWTIQNVYGLAPGDSLESATLFPTEVALPARYSAYTVVLQGTGFGLLDLYNVQTH